MSKLIDAKGKNCPIPVVMAKKEIDGGLSAFTIEVDNATAVENLQRLADSQGFRTTVQSSGGIFSIDFTKAPCEPCAAANAVISQGSPSGKWSVFVGREIIGDGDPELGAYEDVFLHAHTVGRPACLHPVYERRRKTSRA